MFFSLVKSFDLKAWSESNEKRFFNFPQKSNHSALESLCEWANSLKAFSNSDIASLADNFILNEFGGKDFSN